MHHYLYISKTTIDMLYEQIDRSFLEGLGASLSVELGVKLTLSGSAPLKSQLTKLEAVEEALKKTAWVTPLQDGGSYLHDCASGEALTMRFGDLSSFMFVVPTPAPTFLVGSPSHVLGATSSEQPATDATSLEGAMALLEALAACGERDPIGPPPSFVARETARYGRSTLEWLKQRFSPTRPLQRCEFLATKISEVTIPGGQTITVATPIYIRRA